MPYDDLTHDDLATGEIAEAKGLSRVISVDDEHDALGSAWRQLALGFGSQVSDGFKGDEVIEHGPVFDSEFVWKITGVEGGCQRFDISQA